MGDGALGGGEGVVPSVHFAASHSQQQPTADGEKTEENGGGHGIFCAKGENWRGRGGGSTDRHMDGGKKGWWRGRDVCSSALLIFLLLISMPLGEENVIDDRNTASHSGHRPGAS
jgi:hypothetical protein